MKVQNYVSVEERDKFIQSINAYKKIDPRLKNPQLSSMLGLSKGHLGVILRKKASLSKDLYLKYFQDVEPYLNKRMKQYDSLTSESLYALIKKRLPKDQDKIKNILLVDDTFIYNTLYNKRLSSLLNIFDVINDIPPYESINNNMSIESAPDESVGTALKVVKLLNKPLIKDISIHMLGVYLTPEKPWFFSFLQADPTQNLQKENRETLSRVTPKLIEFCEIYKKYRILLPNRIPLSELGRIAGKSLDQMSDDCLKYLKNGNYLKHSNGEYHKDIANKKAAFILAVEEYNNSTN